MKKHLASIILTTAILFSCSKEKIEVSQPPVAKQKPVQTKCVGYFPVDATPVARTAAKGPEYFVRATNISVSVFGATVRLDFKVKGNPKIVTRRDLNRLKDTTFTACNSCTQYVDGKALPATRYRYTINGISTEITTPNAPIISGSEDVPVIFLDFDGARTTAQDWGDRELSASAMTQEQRDRMTDSVQVFFNTYGFSSVIITQDEGVYNSTHYSKRTKCIITDTYEWFSDQAGGVAFVPSFGLETPYLVFSVLLYYNPHYVTVAILHETGHSLGLYHAVDYCGQSYSPGPNFMGAAYNYPIYQLVMGIVLSNHKDGCMNINQHAVVTATLSQ
jgi:hypothetical protein